MDFIILVGTNQFPTFQNSLRGYVNLSEAVVTKLEHNPTVCAMRFCSSQLAFGAMPPRSAI